VVLFTEKGKGVRIEGAKVGKSLYFGHLGEFSRVGLLTGRDISGIIWGWKLGDV